jgi:hypothetical protein
MSGRNKAPVITRNYRASTEAMTRALDLLIKWNQGMNMAAGAGGLDDAKESQGACTVAQKYTE